MIRIASISQLTDCRADCVATESHSWDLPPEARQDEGWHASEWQGWADEWEYRIGPLAFNEIIDEEIRNASAHDV